MILGMTVFLPVVDPWVPPGAGHGVDGDMRLSIKLPGRARRCRPVRLRPAPGSHADDVRLHGMDRCCRYVTDGRFTCLPQPVEQIRPTLGLRPQPWIRGPAPPGPGVTKGRPRHERSASPEAAPVRRHFACCPGGGGLGRRGLALPSPSARQSAGVRRQRPLFRLRSPGAELPRSTRPSGSATRHRRHRSGRRLGFTGRARRPG
jgi:hypothetical protein